MQEEMSAEESKFVDSLRKDGKKEASRFHHTFDNDAEHEQTTRETGTKELEYKRLLTKEIYESVCNWVQQNYCATKRMHINYYYDTPDGTCNGSGITVRIRQQEANLTGTVKYHGIESFPYQSNEQTFKVDSLPMYMELGGRWLSLMGQMVTERICVPVSDGVELMLDKNFYLGKVDYELEVEFLPEVKSKADAFLQWMEQQFVLQENGKHKSARYFDILMAKKGDEGWK